MAIPKRIPIKRIAGYRTEYTGTWSRGQFLGNVLSQSRRLVLDGDRAWFAYLHEFGQDGGYLESTVECPGIGEAGRQAALRLLQGEVERIRVAARNGSKASPPSPTATSRSSHSSMSTTGSCLAWSSKMATARTGQSSTPTRWA